MKIIFGAVLAVTLSIASFSAIADESVLFKSNFNTNNQVWEKSGNALL